MSTKIVSKNSSEVVLKSKVGFFEGMDGLSIVMAPLVSNIVSFFAVAVPLSYSPGWDIPSSILIGVATGTGIAGLGGKYWNAYSLVSELKDTTGTEFGKTEHRAALKTFVNSLLPLGQMYKTGSEIVTTDEEPSDLMGGNHSRNRYHSYSSKYAESYKADTYIKFTPFGSEIRQSISPTPITVWDDAFKSSVSVHEFEEEKTLTSARK